MHILPSVLHPANSCESVGKRDLPWYFLISPAFERPLSGSDSGAKSTRPTRELTGESPREFPVPSYPPIEPELQLQQPTYVDPLPPITRDIRPLPPSTSPVEIPGHYRPREAQIWAFSILKIGPRRYFPVVEFNTTQANHAPQTFAILGVANRGHWHCPIRRNARETATLMLPM